ncbi:protein kinase [Psychrobacter sp. W2-37-MNA-CIBAN-0211]|uniref:serine/threonine protein kinase n=1 Tax=Psychrobacter sp. W2-37-MNA-CIBAN-0211 TaxID=3140443 RepID=UPI003329E716
MKNNTMENSASNLSIIQALQSQAAQLLPLITYELSSRQYDEIAHQRISQQSNGSETNYQGLTRAQHPEFGSVMIKWQLSTDTNQNSFDLNHEANVLKSLMALAKNKNNMTAIAPSILAYDNPTVQILEQPHYLTIVVMPYYPSGSLAAQINSRNHSILSTQRKHHFIVQSAHLIADLHKTGWLHNDIKPSNILLDGLLPNSADNSSVMPDLLLTDFALAQRCNAISVENPAGTPAYLAPERWQGQGATVQSDIYAFGIMMVEVLMGVRPFKINKQSSDPMIDWATQHCQQPMPALPLEYSRYQCIINKVLAKRVEKRYQSMDEVLEGLEHL